MNVNYLLNYWPINNNDVNDYFGQANMNCSGNTSFVSDRKNNPNSALWLASSYCSLPPGVYFYGGDFSILLWVNLQSFNSDTTAIMSFGNGGTDYIATYILGYIQGKVEFDLLNSTSITYLYPPTYLTLNRWHHLAIILKGNTIYYYLNTVLDQSTLNSNLPRNVIRTICKFGKNYYTSSYLNAYLDDIKIYNRSLNATEVAADFNS